MGKMDPGLRGIVQAHPEIGAKLRGAIDEELNGAQLSQGELQELKAGLHSELEEMNRSVKGNPRLLAMIGRRLGAGSRAVAAASMPAAAALADRPPGAPRSRGRRAM